MATSTGSVPCGARVCDDPFAPLRSALPAAIPRPCCTADLQCGFASGGACDPPPTVDASCPMLDRSTPFGDATPCCVGTRCGLALAGMGCLELETLRTMIDSLGAMSLFGNVPEPTSCGDLADDAGAGDDASVE